MHNTSIYQNSYMYITEVNFFNKSIYTKIHINKPYVSKFSIFPSLVSHSTKG